ncbi:hypothetical protein CC79DRAFT_1320387 [Sarocladium strictum]
MDSAGTPTKGSRVKDDQYELAIRILDHYRERSSGRGVQWNQIKMPNRSVKSMQAFYTKINEDIKNLGIEYPAADATPVKEAPPSSGKKRGRASTKAKKVQPKSDVVVSDDDEFAGDLTPSKPPAKKRSIKNEVPAEDSPVAEDIKQEMNEIEKETENDFVISDVASPLREVEI